MIKRNNGHGLSKSSSRKMKVQSLKPRLDHEWGPWNSWADFWCFGELKLRLIRSMSLFIVMCVFLLARGLSHAVIVWYGRSRNKIKVCEASALAGFSLPGLPLTDDSFKWHYLQRNWSGSSFSGVLTHGVTFQIPAQPRERDLSLFFFLNRLHYIGVSPADKQEEKLNDYTVSKALQAAD